MLFLSSKEAPMSVCICRANYKCRAYMYMYMYMYIYIGYGEKLFRFTVIGDSLCSVHDILLNLLCYC